METVWLIGSHITAFAIAWIISSHVTKNKAYREEIERKRQAENNAVWLQYIEKLQGGAK